MTVNLRTLIATLAHDRYMGALIYGAAGGEQGTGKSAYLHAFQQKHADMRIAYCDIQHAIQERGAPALVFELSPKKLLEWGLEEFVPAAERSALNAVFLDNFDVVVNLWDARKKEEFLERLRRLEKVVFPVPVIAMAQTDPVFEQAYQRQQAAPVRRLIRFRELEGL